LNRFWVAVVSCLHYATEIEEDPTQEFFLDEVDQVGRQVALSSQINLDISQSVIRPSGDWAGIISLEGGLYESRFRSISRAAQAVRGIRLQREYFNALGAPMVGAMVLAKAWTTETALNCIVEMVMGDLLSQSQQQFNEWLVKLYDIAYLKSLLSCLSYVFEYRLIQLLAKPAFPSARYEIFLEFIYLHLVPQDSFSFSFNSGALFTTKLFPNNVLPHHPVVCFTAILSVGPAISPPFGHFAVVAMALESVLSMFHPTHLYSTR
jgi:hypothetical protein